MKVSIKDFDVAMDVKNNGIELDISDNNGTHVGDLIVTKTQLIWCQGRTTRANGKRVTWAEFAAHMNQQ
jgi:hypothetical protein